MSSLIKHLMIIVFLHFVSVEYVTFNDVSLFLQQNNSDDTSQHSGTPPSNSHSQRISITSPQKLGSFNMECPLCYNKGTHDDFYVLLACKHIACRSCLERYLMIEILESRTDIGLYIIRNPKLN